MDRCVVRQAIKETKTGKIIGYELVFQGGKDSMYNNNEASAADTISDFLVANSAKIVNDGLMFVTFTPSLLLRNTPKMFGKDKVIIQIEDTVIIHPLAMPLIKKYCEAGYRFAINDFQFTPKYFSMLEDVDYIKVDISNKMGETERRSVENVVEMAHGFQKSFIATGVNTKEVYEYAKELQVDYVEGNYISMATMSKTSKMEFMQGNLYQLTIEITRDEPNIEAIEEIVSRDASLTYALLKMANSAYFAVHHETTSVRQAVVRVGISQMKQWLYLLSFSSNDEENSSEELLKTSFMRANFASMLVKKLKKFPINTTDAYLMGMFSTLEYMIDATIEEILIDIPIVQEVKDALISKEGKAGRLYELILLYERAEWSEIKPIAEELGIKTNEMAQMYMECVDEVNDIWENVVGNVEKP